MTLQRVLAVASKEWRETTRDRMFLLLSFLLPSLWLTVFGNGLVLDVERIPLAVMDHDRTALSREYLSRFMESRYFDFRAFLEHEREIDPLLQRGSIRAALIVPERFQERLRAGDTTSVQSLLDGSFPLRADITKGYIIAINSAFTRELRIEHLARTHGVARSQAELLSEPVRLEVRYLYNERVDSTWSMVPALVMFSLMISAPLLTALGVVREKESGSIYNIYSSTVSRLEFLIGKLAPYLLISTINALLLWLIAVVLFEVPFKGSFMLFFVASVLFILCATGMGLLVSLLVQTQMAALIITIIVSMVPTILFSGMIVPVSSLTPGAQVQAHLFPGMYYTNILRGSFLKNVGLETLWADLLGLIIFALAVRLVALHLFTKRPKA